MVEQVAVQAPEQADTAKALADTIAAFSFSDIGIAFVERVFAVLFHIGASILVFYACKDKKHFWLYPLAIILHTGMDFIGGLYIFNVISLSPWMLEGIVSVFGLAYFSDHTCCFIRRTSEF